MTTKKRTSLLSADQKVSAKCLDPDEEVKTLYGGKYGTKHHELPAAIRAVPMNAP